MTEQGDPPPAPIRILVTGVPDELYKRIEALVRTEMDMVLVGRVTGRVELLLAMDEAVEVVVLGAPHITPPPGICSHLLNEYPNLKILVLAVDTGELDVYWRGLRRKHLRASSEEAIICRIRELHNLDVVI
ncbi:MAG TPA: hypothetical protein VEZ12_16045 [Herpetosiphonaceae bacterium]|jgi:hypothetical protein|nr:hypothetical protein [Herpetosiphonaceae bacterium]